MKIEIKSGRFNLKKLTFSKKIWVFGAKNSLFLKINRRISLNSMSHFSFVVHVEPLVVHGTIPLFSPRRGIDKEGTGGEQGQTQARFNKKPGFTNEQSRSTKEIPGYSLSTAQRDTLGRVYWGPTRKGPKRASKWPYTGIFRGRRVLSFYHL